MTQAFDTAPGSTLLPGTVRERPAAAPYVPWRRPPAQRPRYFLWFTPALALLLVGYLFFDKSFAYLHVPGTPVFVGEIVLAIGIVEVLRIRSPWYHLLRSSPILKALLAFMALCALRLAVDLPRYQIDAVRDSSIWYYGIFAFLVAAAAISEPTFVPRLLRWYRRVLPWYFVWAPIAVALTEVDALASIYVPGTSTPINAFRYTDVAVHIAMGLGFLWLGVDRMVDARPARNRDALVSVVGLIALLAVGTQTRGGFLAALATMAVVVVFLPSGRRRRIALSGGVGLLVALALVLMLNLRIEGERRDVSVQQVAANLSSLTGDQSSEDLSGTVAWRQGFWQQVLDDLLGSRAWLTGLGFGEILPERYEVDVGNTNSETSTQPLRNVHNSHLTMLARIGLSRVRAVAAALGDLQRAPAPLDPAAARGRAGPVHGRRHLAPVGRPCVPDRRLLRPVAGGPARRHLAVHRGRAGRRRDQGPPSGHGAGLGWRPAAAAPPAPWEAAPQPTLPAHLRRLGGRLGWGVADQALSGLIRLAVGAFVARSLGVQELGAFSIAFATYLLVVAAFRGLGTDALAVRHRAEDGLTWRRTVATATGTAVVAGLAAGAACAVIGLLLAGSTGAALLALGLTLPGLLLQDSWRHAFSAAGRGRDAFGNDVAWALALVPAVAILAVTGRSNVGWVMLAWGGSATFAAVIGAVQARLVPRVSGAARWRERDRDLVRGSFWERLSLGGGASQLRLYGLAALAGLTAVGSIQAAELLLSPLTLIVVLAAAAEAEAASVLRQSSVHRLVLFSLLLGAVGAVAAFVWGAVLLLLPDAVGVQLLRSAWLPASQLLVPVTLAVAGLSLSVGAWIGMRALGAASRILRTQGVAVLAYLVAALGGATLGGAAGAAWGSAAGTMIGAAVWWWELRQATHETETAAG